MKWNFINDNEFNKKNTLEKSNFTFIMKFYHFIARLQRDMRDFMFRKAQKFEFDLRLIKLT